VEHPWDNLTQTIINKRVFAVQLVEHPVRKTASVPPPHPLGWGRVGQLEQRRDRTVGQMAQSGSEMTKQLARRLVRMSNSSHSEQRGGTRGIPSTSQPRHRIHRIPASPFAGLFGGTPAPSSEPLGHRHPRQRVLCQMIRQFSACAAAGPNGSRWVRTAAHQGEQPGGQVGASSADGPQVDGTDGRGGRLVGPREVWTAGCASGCSLPFPPQKIRESTEDLTHRP